MKRRLVVAITGASGAVYGIRALQALRESPHAFDLMIADLTMPSMTGLKLARHVRNIRPDLPVVIVSGNPSRTSDTEDQSVRVDVLLAKPFDVAALATAVREALPKR